MDLTVAIAFGLLVVSMLVVPSFRAIAWASLRHPRTTSMLVVDRETGSVTTEEVGRDAAP